MEFVLMIFLIFILSFFWALLSLQKELKKSKKHQPAGKENRIDEGEEIVLFELKN